MLHLEHALLKVDVGVREVGKRRRWWGERCLRMRFGRRR
jgi:hypothetical protein